MAKSRMRHLKGVVVCFKIRKMVMGVKLEDGETTGQEGASAERRNNSRRFEVKTTRAPRRTNNSSGAGR